MNNTIANPAALFGNLPPPEGSIWEWDDRLWRVSQRWGSQHLNVELTCDDTGETIREDHRRLYRFARLVSKGSDGKPRRAVNAEIERARDLYASDEIEISRGARATDADDGGVWVQAWVYLPRP